MAADPYKYFRQEARDLVRDIGQGVLELEKGPTPELARRLLRLTHTLKGAARVVKQSAIAEHAHAIEEVLAPLREEGGAVARDGLDGVLRLLDAIGRLTVELDVVKAPEPARREEPAPVAKARVEEPIAAPRFDAAEIDVLLDAATEASVQLRGLRGGLSTLARMRSLASLLGAHDAERTDGPVARSEKRGARRPIIDEFRDEVSELERRFERGIELAEREIQQIQNAAERLRLVPVDAVFPALERTVRDAARELGKVVEFVGRASGVRIDAGMLGTLQSALIQIARNAVAHGIEPVAERTARGKSARGLVELDVRRRGSRLFFVFRDDGRGIDFDAVRKAAEQRGVHFESAQASPDEVLGVLLRGGISTASTVTEIAGRGVGFDVIREAQESLGGSISVRTEAGRGTEVELVVAASLTSLDALLVEAGGVAAAIPLDAVRRTMRLAVSDVSHGADGAFVVHEGNVVPFMPLARSLGSKAAATAQDTTTAVVVHGEHALAVVGVDRLRGAANVVVRPLPALAVADRIVAGASLDGEGVPRLVLDPEGIVEATRRRLAIAVAAPARALLPILVTDDSLTTRMLEQSILESAGYAVELATSAEEALELAAKRPYALFLVDVEMPGMSGFDFVEKTRADPTLKNVPAILISSRSSPEDLRRGKEVGAAGYMIKGEFDQARLLDMIASLMRAS